MSLGLDIPDPSVNVEDEALDNVTRCACGRARTLTADDLLMCPACDLPPGSVLAALSVRPLPDTGRDALPIPA